MFLVKAIKNEYNIMQTDYYSVQNGFSNNIKAVSLPSSVNRTVSSNFLRLPQVLSFILADSFYPFLFQRFRLMFLQVESDHN